MNAMSLKPVAHPEHLQCLCRMVELLEHIKSLTTEDQIKQASVTFMSNSKAAVTDLHKAMSKSMADLKGQVTMIEREAAKVLEKQAKEAAEAAKKAAEEELKRLEVVRSHLQKTTLFNVNLRR